jgi:hypothetical protein
MSSGQGARGVGWMMVFLDANPVIYLIEQPAAFGSKTTARVTKLLADGERLAVSDLVRMECEVGPFEGERPRFAGAVRDVFPITRNERTGHISHRLRPDRTDSGRIRFQTARLASPGCCRRARLYAFSHQRRSVEEVPWCPCGISLMSADTADAPDVT